MDYRNISYAPYSVSHNFNNSPSSCQIQKIKAFLLLFVILFSSFLGIFILTPSFNVAAEEIESRMEPVVIAGVNIPDFNGTPIDEIWVYAHIGGDWIQIPFQIDERNDINGSYFYDAQDGLLDENDEIVFMPFDCGDDAQMDTTVVGSDPQRYEITVTDPLDSSSKYAYIFTSSTLTKEFTENYVDYDPIANVINATDYRLGFDDTLLGITDELRINTTIQGDDTDLLDRWKFRFQIPTIPSPTQYEEDDFTYELAGLRNGPVRVILQVSFWIEDAEISASMGNTIFAYKSYSQTVVTMNANISLDFVRISSDYLASSIPMTYHDSNMNNLTIDGSTDTPSSLDAPTWTEVTGSHGTVVAVQNISELAGTQFLQYEDDSGTIDPPESETGQYGNHGILVNNPTNSSTMYWTHYYLEPNQVNIGSTYLNYTEQPIKISNVSQYVDPSPPPQISDVTSLPDPQEVGSIVNISAMITDNLNQLDGAWVDITDPDEELVGNFTMEYDSSMDRYYHERTYDEVGIHQFVIWAKDASGNWNSYSGEFELMDTISPSITDATSLPETQEAGDYVNISAVVTDLLLGGVWINVIDPGGEMVGNFSMAYDSSNGRYYDNRIYSVVGTYEFMIWANDTSSNWDLSIGEFNVEDTTECEISDVTALPAPQEIDEYVNLSASVTDIVDVHRVWIYITDPDGEFVGNFSMKKDPQTGRYFHNQTYDILGTYDYIIWAKDNSSNWNSSSGQFTIQDITAPVANAGLDHNVYIGTTVPFDGSGSTDNVNVVNYTWTFIYVTARTLYGISAIFTFDSIGIYEVTLTVRDASGNTATDTLQVNVTDVPPGGSISGTVKDAEGNPISNATVRLDGTTYTTMTDENGEFTLSDIPAGTYNLTVDKVGYQSITISDLPVTSGQDNTLTEDSLIMAKEKGEDEEDSGGPWIIIIVVIVIILILLFLFVRPMILPSRKEEEMVGELGFECPVCGTSVRSDLNNCPSCGVAFSTEKEVEVVEVSAAVEAAEVEAVSAEEGEGAETGEEGEEIGIEIGAAEDEDVEEVEEEPGPSDIYMCPSCGAFISSAATICDVCGFDFEEEDEEDISDEEMEEGEEEEPEGEFEEEVKEGEEEPFAEEPEGKQGKGEEFEAKEMLEMFKEELKPEESKGELKEDYKTLSKEIDEILGESEEGEEVEELEEEEEEESEGEQEESEKEE
jgi:hypothetical protein